MVVNITVRKRLGDGKSSPVKAKVLGFASNLNNQVKKPDLPRNSRWGRHLLFGSGSGQQPGNFKI